MRLTVHGIGSCAALALVAASLGACADAGDSFKMPKISELNPFKKPETILAGKRVDVLTSNDDVEIGANPAAGTTGLPAEFANDSWSQPGGVASNSPGNLALSGTPHAAWKTGIGEGSSKRGRLTASPIVTGGRVFTLDATGLVSSFNASGGSKIWAVSLTPETEPDTQGYGGGLAAEGDVIYAATGYGTVVALSASGGQKIWEKSLGSPIRTSPTAADGRVFVNTAEGEFFCLQASDGAELWRFRGVPQVASILNNASPAVSGDMVVVPYPSGEVVALKVASGEAYWADSVASGGNTSSLASLADPARPVIDGDMVFAVGHAGKMIATAQKSGARVWSLPVPGKQMPWVAGGAVYVVDTKGRLRAVSRAKGETIWVAKLAADQSWSGPTLAGGRLWLASSKGNLVSVDAISGKVLDQRDLGDPVYIAPVVAGGRMYVLTDTATLIALN